MDIFRVVILSTPNILYQLTAGNVVSFSMCGGEEDVSECIAVLCEDLRRFDSLLID